MSTITRTIDIVAPAAQLWQAVVCRTDRISEWMPHVTESRLLTPDPDQVGSRALYAAELHGVTGRFVAELTEVLDGQYLAYRSVSGNVRASGYWRFEAVAGDRTRLTFFMDYRLPGAILGRIADAVVFHRALEDRIAEGLHNLKRRSEMGRRLAA